MDAVEKVAETVQNINQAIISGAAENQPEPMADIEQNGATAETAEQAERQSPGIQNLYFDK